MLDAGSGKKMRDLGSLPPQSGDVIADKYVVESVVGTGGMGVVVAARHLQLGQQVAIKLLRLSGLEPDRQVEARARFLREGQAAAALSSDHVVRIHDVGTLESGEPFMVMELLRGEDLARLLDRQGPAPVPVAVDYVLQVCHAVAEAHASGIVHRDLKPSNLFVSLKSDGRPIVKVLDFGISKTASAAQEAFDGNLTDTRSVVGSPFYMSPEQVRDAKRVDARTDVWSLGMILYEMLAGEPAFKASTLPAICAAITADAPRPLREGRPEVPSELEAVIVKCLEKDPERRYQKVNDLVRALSPFAPGPGGAKSAEYASRQDVMALSEPFAIPVPDAAPTHHFQTMQSAPPSNPSRRPPEAGPRVAPPATGAWLPATPMGSGTRLKQEGDGSSTLISSSGNQASLPAPAGPSATEKLPASRVSRGAAAWAAALGVLFAIGTFWFVVSRATVVTDTGRTTQFTLNVDSRPSGASVLEGTRLLGTTPYSVSLSRESLQRSPRRLTLELDGYERYSIEQGTSDHDVRVLALLTKTSTPQAPAGSAPAAPSNDPAPAPSGTAPRARATYHSLPATTATKPSSSTDIRLER